MTAWGGAWELWVSEVSGSGMHGSETETTTPAQSNRHKETTFSKSNFESTQISPASTTGGVQ